jgi:hypothetical protein
MPPEDVVDQKTPNNFKPLEASLRSRKLEVLVIGLAVRIDVKNTHV